MEGLDKYVNFDIHGKGSRILLLLKASLRADFENEVVTNNVDLPDGAPPELYDLIDLNCLAVICRKRKLRSFVLLEGGTLAAPAQACRNGSCEEYSDLN